jgi:diguanylate cyclase (GGDEF)-like protein
MTPKVVLKVCRHFQMEIEAVAGDPEFSGIVTLTYPSFCEHPQNDTTQWQREFASGTEPEDSIIIVGACCSSSGRNHACDDRLWIARLDQCFYLFASRSLIDYYMRQGAYILTPGWLAEWREHIGKWGFDRETARQFFAESATKLLLLDTQVDPDSACKLAAFSEYLGLPAETLPVGLDYFRLFLRGIISDRLRALGSFGLGPVTGQSHFLETDYAMALDLLENLAQKLDEEEAIEGILDLFSMLFAPGKLIYFPVNGVVVGKLHSRPEALEGGEILRSWLKTNPRAMAWSPGQEGFLLPLTHDGKIVGALEASHFLFPNYIEKYRSLAKSISGLCGLVVDNARLFCQVQELANIDGLTQLNTRRRFFQLASMEFSRAQRYGSPLTAIMFDIDHFKQVNDTYGHAMGDRVLTALGACCLRTIRTIDICGRYGGEEFAILLPETPLPQAIVVAERLRDLVASTITENEGRSLRVTISLGLADMKAGHASLDELLNRCDSALYVAKVLGRNRVQVAQDEQSEHLNPL